MFRRPIRWWRRRAASAVYDGADPFDGARITAVHADAGGLWVLVAKRDLYRLDGDSPELVASLEEAAGTCLGSHDGSVWIGGDPAALWRLRGERLERVVSFDGAPTHEAWHTPWGGPPAVFSMASDGTDLYVSVHVGGILRSGDGTSWTPTIDLHDDVHQVAVGPDGTVWAATGMRGLAESNDRGETWRYHTRGLARHVPAGRRRRQRRGARRCIVRPCRPRRSGLPVRRLRLRPRHRTARPIQRCRRATPARWRRRPCRRGAAQR